jgi:hypothetical protein
LVTVSMTTCICDSCHSDEVCCPLPWGRKMSAFSKLVSVLLLLLIPTVSTAALSRCPREMPGMNNSQSQMADMGMVAPQFTFSPAGTNRCCEVSPAETVPATPARALVSHGNDSVLTMVTSIVPSWQTAGTRTECDQARIASPPAQALLCVFLI